MSARANILERREVSLDESYREATIFFSLEHLLIQIVGYRAACGCLELKTVSLCQENRNWSSGLQGQPGNEGPISQRKGATAISP